MDYQVITWGEREQITDPNSARWSNRPDLIALPFPENPVPTPDDFPHLFYVTDGNKIVGNRKTVPDIAHMEGEERRWSWNFDTFIDPEYRGKGVGRHLVDLQVAEIAKRGIISAAAFSAPGTLRIYERLGFQIIGHAPRMTLVRNTRPFLQSRFRNAFLLTTASMLGNMVLATERTLRSALHRSDGFEIIAVDKSRFGELFNHRVVRVQPNYWARQADWVLARLQPDDTLFEITRAGDREPCALFVLRDRVLREKLADAQEREIRRLTLMHFEFLDDADDLSQLLAAALRQLLQQTGADVADTITSYPPLLKALATGGFRPRGPGMSFVFSLPPGESANTTLTGWHLTHFCSDGYSFE